MWSLGYVPANIKTDSASWRNGFRDISLTAIMCKVPHHRPPEGLNYPMSRLPLAPAPAGRADPAEAFGQALMLYQQGDHTGARRQLKVVLRKHPRHFDGLHLMSILEAQRGHYKDAEKLLRQALLINPNSPDAQSNRGNMLRELGDYQGAVTCYDLALRLKPQYPNALNNRAIALIRLGKFDDALASYDAALAQEPRFAAAFHNRGLAHAHLRNFGAAIADYDKALALDPAMAGARIDRANAFAEMGEIDQAVDAYKLILAIEPHSAAAHYNLGLALMRHGRFDQAIASLDAVVTLEPAHAAAHDSRGNTLFSLGRYSEALESYDHALRAAPQAPSYHNNRGTVLQRLNRHTEALASFDAALRADPNLASAHSNRAQGLLTLGRIVDARAAFDRAIAADPTSLDLRANRAAANMTARQYENALDDLAFVHSVDPEYPYLLGNLLHCKMQCCDWRNIGPLCGQLEAAIETGRRVALPFIATTLTDKPELHLRAAQSWADDMKLAGPAPVVTAHAPHKKIRIAYISADFRDHPVATQTVELFERHDRSRFELTAISLATSDGSAIRKRLEAAFDTFHDVSAKGDAETAALIRTSEADIAVDLTGYTDNCRPGILALRPAPIQASFLGYPATMGVQHIDYIIADERVLPPGSEPFYSEKIVRLPDSFFVSDTTRAISDAPLTRADAGLPEDGFVFCCFNNRYKIAPEVFVVWMRLLRDMPGSVLWLAGGSATSAANLRAAAELHGIASGRLLFAARVASLSDHLARHRLADLFLDTLPYNAHSTATDALWAGLPVLTCAGNAFAGRVAASVLSAIGLPELIATSLDEYEKVALMLARNASALAELKSKLSQNRDTSPLFDTRRFCQHLETAYTEILECRHRGEPPQGFTVRKDN